MRAANTGAGQIVPNPIGVRFTFCTSRTQNYRLRKTVVRVNMRYQVGVEWKIVTGKCGNWGDSSVADTTTLCAETLLGREMCLASVSAAVVS